MRPRGLVASILLALLVVAFAETAIAGVTEVALPAGQSKPLAVAVDEEGRVWTTLDGSWALARHDPRTNQTVSFPLAAPSTGETDSLYSLAIDAQGNAWTASQTHLHRVSPEGDAKAYALPATTDLSGGVLPTQDGTIWIALVTADQLVAFDPETEEMRTVPAPAQGFGPLEWADGPDGTAFVTGTYGNTISTLDENAGTLSAPPTAFVAAPTGIAYDGRALWIGEHGGNNLMRYDPATGATERFPTTASPYYPISGPSGVAVAPDGAVWFAVHFADRVSRVDPATRTIVEYEVPSAPGTNMQRVALDPQGRVWFGEWSKDRLGYAEYGGEQPDFELPVEVNVTRGQTVRVPLGIMGEAKFGAPHDKLQLAQEGQDLMITAAADAPARAENVVVSKLDGKTYVGRYMRVNVVEEASTPAPATVLVVLGILVAALASAWRRR